MHPLLRDVLLNRFAEWPGTLQTMIHQRAWQAFSARSMMHDAVHHAVQAGAPEAAAQMVEANALDLFVSGELRQLAALVRLLPPATVTQRAGLRLWLAWLQVFEHRMDECADSIQALLATQDPSDPVAQYRLVLLRGLYAVLRDDTASALDILPELLRPPAQADSIALAGRRNILTWIYLFRGNYADARQVQLDPGLFLINGRRLLGSPFGLLAGQCLLGLTYSVEGDMIQAERIYRQVLHEAEKQGPACIDAACLAAGLLSEVLYELDSKEAAVQLLENRIDVLEQVSIPDTVLRVMVIMGRARRLAGLPLEAFGFMDRLEQYAVARRLDRLLAYSLAMQMRWHLEDRNFSVARDLLARLEALGHSSAQTGKVALAEVPLVVERARIEMCLDSGDLAVGYGRLIKLIEFCEAAGFKRRAAALQVQCAAVQHRLGHHDRAAQHMRQAMRQGHKLGLLRSLLDAHKDAGALAEAAALSANQEPVLAFYAQRLIDTARKATTRQPPLNNTVGSSSRVSKLAELSGREADVVRLLAQAMPNKKIARSLGLSPETVKWHLKNIYTKLDLTSRDEVVALCRQSALFNEHPV
jgi:LuxR family maltose regulon positive regulatory protein